MHDCQPWLDVLSAIAASAGTVCQSDSWALAFKLNFGVDCEYGTQRKSITFKSAEVSYKSDDNERDTGWDIAARCIGESRYF